METKRLKNIAILILLLLNGFLLALLGYQELQAVQASRTAKEELEALFTTEELTLSFDSGVMEQSLSPLTLTRQMETEGRIAAFILGEVVPSESQGGGIHGYQTELGAVQFRAGGGFDTVWIDRYVGLTEVMLEHPRICGFCYTQLTDIEQEQNGLYKYDRSRKFSDMVYDRIKEANLQMSYFEKHPKG